MRKILHCDADCFFVALEIRDDPRLSGIPVAVGGQPGRRGVISTCNYEARAFGVRSAMASAFAKRLCPQLIILPHNMAKYQQAATAMRAVFLSYSDLIEPLSLDEAFIDVSHSLHCLGSATLIAKEIRRRIKKEVGITVSAGVAGNKFLAKVASDWQKPDGLTVIDPAREKFFLQRLPVTCIPGVGPTTSKKLHRLGLKTCFDIQKVEKSQLEAWFGQFGPHLYHLSRGDDDRPVKARENRKSISVEHTFSEDLKQIEQGYHFLEELSGRLSQRLENIDDTNRINGCFIKVKFADFKQTTMEMSTKEFSLHCYQQLFGKILAQGMEPIRLLGIGLKFHNLQGAIQGQRDFFNN